MGNNGAPLVADLFIHSYEADCVQHLQNSKFKKHKTSFNVTFRYMLVDDVISLNNPKCNDYIYYVIYPYELEIKDTTDAPKWANYLDHRLEFDEDGELFTRLYDKRDDFDFPYLQCK